MSKKMIIVESPAKAKKIQSFLDDSYVVVACKGHITDLAKGGKFNLGVDIENNFKPKYVLIPEQIPTLNQLMDIAENASLIYLGQDRDREGEQISYHVRERLKDLNKPFKRMTFSEIKKEKILKAIKDAGDININLCQAAEARRILDRIVGFMASPFVMNFFGPNLSAGRVQSVVTKMIVDREREIENFKPEEYWNIKVNLTNNSNSFWAKYDPKVSNQTNANEIKKLFEENKNFIVTQVVADEEAKKPNPPMITSQLQRVMAKSFGFSADQTMKAAQGLYETGYVTYIRTDSVRTEPESIISLRNWLKSNNHPIPKNSTVFKTKDAAQDAHECIRPTDLNIGPDNTELAGDQKKVYEIIWKYFVASQMNPAIYDTLKVTIQLKDHKQHILKVSGKALKDPGFLKIMGISDDSKIDIPHLSKGDELTLINQNSIILEKKYTQPPPRFSTDTIISEMEKRNIGRPATYAEALSKITSRNYVEMEGKTYRPTTLGKQVTDSLAKFFSFMSYDYSAEMEKKLDEIEAGKEDHVKMLKQFFEPFKEELNKAYVSNGSTICTQCKSHMVLKSSRTSNEKFWGCSSYPACRFTLKQLDQER